jgi:hypothetical protein
MEFSVVVTHTFCLGFYARCSPESIATFPVCRWDHMYQSASIIETIDGHSDVLYLCLRHDWM